MFIKCFVCHIIHPILDYISYIYIDIYIGQIYDVLKYWLWNKTHLFGSYWFLILQRLYVWIYSTFSEFSAFDIKIMESYDSDYPSNVCELFYTLCMYVILHWVHWVRKSASFATCLWNCQSHYTLVFSL